MPVQAGCKQRHVAAAAAARSIEAGIDHRQRPESVEHLPALQAYTQCVSTVKAPGRKCTAPFPTPRYDRVGTNASRTDGMRQRAACRLCRCQPRRCVASGTAAPSLRCMRLGPLVMADSGPPAGRLGQLESPRSTSNCATPSLLYYGSSFNLQRQTSNVQFP